MFIALGCVRLALREERHVERMLEAALENWNQPFDESHIALLRSATFVGPGL